MYYKFQKLKPPGSGEYCEHWEDVGESYKADDVKTIFQKWRDLILYFKDGERIFTWDFGKDESLLLAIDDKIITIWVYEKSGKIILLGEKKIEGVDVLDFLKQLENWQNIFDILKLLNN